MIGTRQVIAAALFVVVSLGAGALGGLATRRAVPEWYSQLARPAWAPPNWVFGPVWTVLYLMMGISAWLVWRRAGGLQAAALPLALFLAQLALNTAWSVIFFGLRQPGWALLEVLALWAMILATLLAFWRIWPAAGALLLPYLAWVTFAGGLNYAIWRLNR
jgi:benzodiazapine receptor